MGHGELGNPILALLLIGPKHYTASTKKEFSLMNIVRRKVWTCGLCVIVPWCQIIHMVPFLDHLPPNREL